MSQLAIALDMKPVQDSLRIQGSVADFKGMVKSIQIAIVLERFLKGFQR